MTHVVPLTRELPDIGERTEPDEATAGMVVPSVPEDDCALCELGCCYQTYRIAPTDQDPVLVHRMAGSA